jgi:inner membrane protein involved in colicin E2 resistance
MIKRITAIVFIFICTSAAWLILSGTVMFRTDSQDRQLTKAVGQLWGVPQEQVAPRAYYLTETPRRVESTEDGKVVAREVVEQVSHELPIIGTTVDARLFLKHRQKGLLWYATYSVDFSGRYRVRNPTAAIRQVHFKFTFPSVSAVYDDFHLRVGDQEAHDLKMEDGSLDHDVAIAPGQEVEFAVHYRSQGMKEWGYSFGQSVHQVRNFHLTLHTDFPDIDFPDRGISPSAKTPTPGGWQLEWSYRSLLTGVRIGLILPEKLNPGPWVSMVTAAAPVSLFLFFFVVFLFSTLRNVRIHPMNYFFMAAGFFSFHLLLAYLVDHVSIPWAFTAASAVSVGLVISYMRLVVGPRFAFLETALAQLVYLVFFSYTFFFQGFTGLSITLLCIATLFVAMQATGRINWDEVFERK